MNAETIAERAEMPTAETKQAISRWCKAKLKMASIRAQCSEAKKPFLERQKAAKEAIMGLCVESGAEQVNVAVTGAAGVKPVYVRFASDQTSFRPPNKKIIPVSYTHLRAHET